MNAVLVTNVVPTVDRGRSPALPARAVFKNTYGSLVRMERPAPIRSSWVTLRVGELHNAEPHAKEPVMNKVRFIGLDVHAETIAVAAAEPGVKCGHWV